MLERRQNFIDHLSLERESYSRRRQLLEQQCMIDRLSQIPREKLNGCYQPQTAIGNERKITGYLSQYDSGNWITKPDAVSGYTNDRLASVRAGANVNISVKQGMGQPIDRSSR